MSTKEVEVSSLKKEVEVDDGAPLEWKKYDTYHCNVDPDQDDKATEIRMFTFARPHMRAFHVCWWSFFMAFFVWFAVSPLLPEIKKTLGLTKKQVWITNIAAVTGTFFVRFLIGPYNDKYGARTLMAAVLCMAAIPTACTGFVNSFLGLLFLRLAIGGVAGSSFVMCQYWMTRMFAKEIVGTANAVAGGWGNLGGGVTLLVMGTLLFPLFKNIYGGNAEKAWRTVCVIPAFVTFVTGIVGCYISDDAPKGNYTEMKKHGSMPEVSAGASLRHGAVNFNSWLLFFHYACTFGVELTMDHGAALYFHDEFGLTTERSAAIASLFGWMNIFSRGMGGYISDVTNRSMGMRGRLITQFVTVICEGICILIFATTKSLGGSILVMVVFSIFCQGGCGTTYGIVPYVNPAFTGSVSGIVGAGGNAGAIAFGSVFAFKGYRSAFTVMGWTVFACSFTTFFIFIQGCRGLVTGGDEVIGAAKKTITVPEQSKAVSDDESDEIEL